MSLHNPHTTEVNKPALSLAEFVSLMALMTSLVALSIDAMLPALDRIGLELGSQNQQETYLIVSLFFIGMAFGQLYYGPVSDTKGRRYAIVSGLVVFSVGTVICMFAPTMEILLLGRVIQAFGVSGPRIASLAVIRDQYAGDAMARVMSFIMMVFILVPMIAPLFGQLIMLWFEWRHIFTAFLFIGFAGGAWFFLRQPETLPANKRHGFSWARLFDSSKFILTHKVVMGYTLAMGFIFGAFVSYLGASQAIFDGIYHVGQAFPLYFAVLAFSIGFASFVNGKLVMRMGMFTLSKIALAGVVLGSTTLSILALSYTGKPPLPIFVMVLFTTFFFVGILFGNLNAMAMLPLGHVAGLGAAIIGFISSFLSVPIAIFIGSYIVDSVSPMVMGFLVCSIAASIAVFWAGNPHQKEDSQEMPEQVIE
ncbi:multidrug effflux MFS transporter [Aestuariibacter sp. AA17]|uniref:Bcr/CflA family efflux transporter n=1 Tax=Fluctibacter corallii TaxID=2984329 RepID=A0ABT3AB10_9ALTE|nr:multidrug effflux MFS transporter [Aestuariibacter sp. AA17]MCV2885861.1 multidrug effflux MFS transporter [Aestuariibacter sp. AA17]